jgi:hypothetical protein
MLQAIYGVDEAVDLYAIVPNDGNLFITNGLSSRGDRLPMAYEFNSASMAGDDGDNVIRPSSISVGSPGRYLKKQIDYNTLANKPSLSTVATTGQYNDLSGRPSLATVANTGAYNDLSGKPSIPSAQQAYQGTTLRSPAFPIFKSATVASGIVTFHLTADGTSGGTALFPNGMIEDSLNLYVGDSTASYQLGYVFSNSNKTLTVTANKLTTANILTGILGQTAANGSVVKMQIWGY